MAPQQPVDLTNDFGFSFHDEGELKTVQVTQENVSMLSTLVKTKEYQIEQIIKLIQPLLDNLKKNPDKDYIYWPNRVAKIEEFEKKLKELSA